MSQVPVVSAFFLLLPVYLSRGEVSSTFDTDAEGWKIVAYPFRGHVPSPAIREVAHDPANGNPPGSIRVGDVYGETGVAAPGPYLGDQSAHYGGTLYYDIFLRYTDGIAYPAVVLNGGTMSLYYDSPSPPLNEWSSRAIPLTEPGWRVSGSHQPATAADLILVLMNLQGLYIYTEWRTGPDDTNVDNVRLAPGMCDFVPDFDHDCDVDTHDLALFESCVTGPAVPYTPHVRPGGCALPPNNGGYLPADLDNDLDVDQSDFGIFERCFSGANRPADPNCVPKGPYINGTWRSDCKPSTPTGDPYPWCGKDELDVVAQGSSLRVAHHNVAYNCCLDRIEVTMDAQGSNLRFYEKEILTAPCFCLCCYDTTTTVEGVAPGAYRIEYCWDDNETGHTCLTKDVIVAPKVVLGGL